MRLLFIVGALICLGACDAPWAGPSLPVGSHELSVTQLSRTGPIDFGPDVLASTSLAEVRNAVIAHATQAHSGPDVACRAYPDLPDPCWMRLSDSRQFVYIAVITNSECVNATKEAVSLGAGTLYFIHWIGSAQGVCNMAMARPNWRLYAASRRDLPSAGTLTVRLELQGTEQRDIDTQVALS